VHLWTAARYPFAAEKWATWPSALWVGAPVVLALLCYGALLRSIIRRSRRTPLVWNAAVVFFSFLGLSLALYPHMIPSVVSPVTVHRAAAASGTLVFMLVVTAVLLPVILAYTAYTYRVFGGTVNGNAEQKERPLTSG
jgi:cytochrome d ubiquinol oxidase subunit II